MMNLNLTGTPEIISEEIIDFCKEINKQEKPVYLDVLPVEQSIENECFVNVQKQIDNKGGSFKYGWIIGEWRPVMLEAVFHAVWVEPTTNSLIDVSSPTWEADKILFLPDSSREYKGKQINNIRKALKKDKDIDDFIKAWNEYFEEINKGELADYHGLMVLSRKSEDILKKQKDLFIKLVRKYNPEIAI
jgi:hypothetical protein